MRRILQIALALAFLILAPATAVAHGGHDHDAGKAAFSVPSCPDGPGHVCGCGNLVPLSGEQPLVAAFFLWSLVVALPARRARHCAAAGAPPFVPFLPSARPRAPPSV